MGCTIDIKPLGPFVQSPNTTVSTAEEDEALMEIKLLCCATLNSSNSVLYMRRANGGLPKSIVGYCLGDASR
jgi:hypothetical protein